MTTTPLLLLVELTAVVAAAAPAARAGRHYLDNHDLATGRATSTPAIVLTTTALGAATTAWALTAGHAPSTAALLPILPTATSSRRDAHGHSPRHTRHRPP